MKILIVHSHLNPGGVTRIIESQAAALRNVSTVFFTGAPPPSKSNTLENESLFVCSQLNYLERRPYTKNEAEQRVEEILNCFEKVLEPGTIVHVHNLNLGKNPLVTYAVYLLAQKGYVIFNHAHDFAEDRPANMRFMSDVINGGLGKNLNEVMYPDLPNYHFGVLNSFDKNRLLEYGINAEQILWIPNPVNFTRNETDKQKAKREISLALETDQDKLLVTYPVRVIGRKNIGEFLLLSVVFKEEAEFVVTQPPKNPLEKVQYEKWLGWCKRNEIRVVFEAGTRVDFSKLIVASDFCITTSIREGFGMVYLEPWLADTPVVGRNISYITEDFKNDGITFPALYDSIAVDGVAEDFKDLDMQVQMKVISDIKNKERKRQELFEQNPALSVLFKQVSRETIGLNASIIHNKYSIEGYGIKLQNRYNEMAQQTGAPGT